ncbi:MAG TPA: hypothetical protein VN630_11040 [Rhodanobacteraceae bacterium]|nr:hypothetical protein [Rhodanobacteraceae bacterium]
MNDSAFFHVEFWLLLLASLAVPLMIYFGLLWVRQIQRLSILLFAVMLLLMSAADVLLLQHLSEIARSTPSVFDDKVFASEFSLTLYLLPLLSAGIGINLISNVLTEHLHRVLRASDDARFDADPSSDREP